MKRVGRLLRRPTKICLNCQAHVSDALLGIHLSRGRWPRRQLQDCCGLIFVQVRQQHGPAIRKFERIVMGGGLVFVDLAKDGGLVVDCPRPPPE